ncbi:MAG: TSCPD domain-containing protein, partial [Deltaproteobacteria bacterium]|nr:TSCPD domain-containing protein [Deltaproteobacteria bacterium]
MDWDKFEDTVKKAVHFLDNVIEMNSYPIPQIEKVTKSNRKIGLGVMGFADMLIRLGVPYNSEEAITLAEDIMAFIQEKGREASVDLGLKRGSFPNFKGSVYDGRKKAVRNATVTTIAPTGTISIISGCSSGIEPLFALAFTRNVMEGTELLEVNPLFEEAARDRGFDSAEIMKEVASSGTLHDVAGIPGDVKKVFVTAHDITPEWHIRMQAAFQKYTDNAVSKTVNFPNEATVEDVMKVYLAAYRLGCKGVTVYRDGSRDVQVLNKGSEKPTALRGEGVAVEAIVERHPALPHKPKSRGEVAFGVTKKMKTGCGNLYVTINEDEEGRPFEIFTQIGKAGGCVASQCEAMGRMTSLALRSGVEAQDIVRQMRGISCHLPVGYGNGKVMSCADAVAQAMEWYLGLKMNSNNTLSLGGLPGGYALESHRVDLSLAPEILKRGACPDCGGTVEHADGCVVCRGCGYSECG